MLLITALVWILLLSIFSPGQGRRARAGIPANGNGPAFLSSTRSDGAGTPLVAAVPRPERLWARASSAPLGWGGGAPCQGDLLTVDESAGGIAAQELQTPLVGYDAA